jgi:Kef-type K+ transport system membrane component KefB
MDVLDYIRSNAVALPQLTKFALGMVFLFGVLALSRRLQLPAVVGLLFTGVIVGPHVLQVFGENRPVADFFGDLGKLLLMFFAGLEIDLALFRRALRKAVTFGLITTSIPLLLGAAVGLLFGYRFLTAVVLGSLLASHTLLGMSIVTKIGAQRLEPFIVTVGATVLSDMLSLVVFAVCVTTFQRGFSPSGLALQLAEIAAFVPLLLLGLGRAGK